jgi:ankyrin repeat protein
MSNFFNRILGKKRDDNKVKSKSTSDLNFISQSQHYLGTINVKEKDLSKLHLAAWRGDYDKLVRTCSVDKIDKFDKEGRTPLYLAVASNNLRVVEQLLRNGAKIEYTDKEGRTPIIIVKH